MDSAQLSRDDPGRYSPTTLDHFRNPRNVGRLEDASAVGQVDDLVNETFISLSLTIQDGRVTAARHRTFGCSACIAASSLLTELVTGQTVHEARSIDGPTLLTALDGLPSDQDYCAGLAAQALRQALDRYERA